jgi:hypothetical protein
MGTPERRIAERKAVEPIKISELTSLVQYKVIAKSGEIIDASTSGMLLMIDRKDFVQKQFRENLSIDEVLGQHVVMYLPQMDLDLDGRITRAEHVGKGKFEVAIQFSEDVPLYWRECLVDLLPSPGEIGASNLDSQS